MNGPWTYHMCQAHNLIRSQHNSWMNRKTVWKIDRWSTQTWRKSIKWIFYFRMVRVNVEKKSLSQEYIPPLTTQNSRARTSASLLRNMHDMGCLFTFYTSPFIDLYTLMCIFSYSFSRLKINFLKILDTTDWQKMKNRQLLFLIFFRVQKEISWRFFTFCQSIMSSVFNYFFSFFFVFEKKFHDDFSYFANLSCLVSSIIFSHFFRVWKEISWRFFIFCQSIVSSDFNLSKLIFQKKLFEITRPCFSFFFVFEKKFHDDFSLFAYLSCPVSSIIFSHFFFVFKKEFLDDFSYFANLSCLVSSICQNWFF